MLILSFSHPFLLISFSHIFFFSFFSSHFLFLISLLLFFFSLGSPLTGFCQRRKLPLPFLMLLVTSTIFLPHFSYFFYPFIASRLMWLIVSHTFKCTTWLFPCVTPSGCHVASTKSHHVSSDTLCLENRVIPTISKFDEI